MCYLLCMKRWMIPMAATSLLLPSCMVTTSVATAKSCIYEPKHNDAQPMQIYRKGNSFYLKVSVRYVCEEDKLLIGGMMAVPDSEVELPVGYHDEKAPQTMYVLMDEEAVKHYTGVSPKPIKGPVPRYYSAEDWDASAATSCKLIRPLPKKRIDVRGKDKAECWLLKAKDEQWDKLHIYVPSTYGWDAVYKLPLAAVLAVGVDIPCTLVANAGLIGASLLVAPVATVSQQQQQGCELPEPPAPQE